MITFIIAYSIGAFLMAVGSVFLCSVLNVPYDTGRLTLAVLFWPVALVLLVGTFIGELIGILVRGR